jgi:hypothetical protein
METRYRVRSQSDQSWLLHEAWFQRQTSSLSKNDSRHGGVATGRVFARARHRLFARRGGVVVPGESSRSKAC